MILMIKNAHYFNEPSSDVYKVSSSPSEMYNSFYSFFFYFSAQFASVLRKFIISHCAELERKFHTVVPK